MKNLLSLSILVITFVLSSQKVEAFSLYEASIEPMLSCLTDDLEPGEERWITIDAERYNVWESGRHVFVSRCHSNLSKMLPVTEVANKGGDPEHTPNREDDDNPEISCRDGSIIKVDSRALGEVLPIVGTPFKIFYDSSRVQGRKLSGSFKIPLFDTNSNVIGLTLSGVFADGRTFGGSHLNIPNQEHHFVWDNKDSLGNVIAKSSNLDFTITYHITGGIEVPVNFSTRIGSLKVEGTGLGGWQPNVLHAYDEEKGVVYFGNGSILKADWKAIGSGEYQIVSRDGSEIYIFNINGKLLRTLSGLTGITLYSFSYDPTWGTLASITDKFGSVTSFAVSPSTGRVSSITSPNGLVTSLSYDLNGYLEAFTTPSNETYEMAYSADGLISSFEKPEGEISTFSYDNRGGLIKDEHSGGSSTTLTQTTDSSDYPLKRITTTSEMGREVERDVVNVYLSMDQGNATTKDKNGSVHMRYEDGAVAEFFNTHSVSKSLKADPRFGEAVKYDGRVNFTVGTKSFVREVTKEVDYVDPNDPLNFSGLRQIIKIGNDQSISSFDNNTRTWTTVSAEGRESKYQLNSFEDIALTQTGNLAPINYSYNSKGLLSKLQSENREFVINYNNLGYVSQIIDPLGSVINYDRDLSGRILREINPEGRETKYEWDLNGRMTKLITPNSNVHEFVYNAQELLGEYIPPQIPPYDTSTVYDYNLDKDLTKITLPDEREINFNYNTAGKLISKGNDDEGLYLYSYSVEDPSRVSSVTKSDSIKIYRDYLGPLLKSEEQVVIANDDMIARIDFSYDDMFRLSKITLEDSAGDFGYSPYFTYDKDSSLITAGDVQVKRNNIGQVIEKKLGKVQALYSYDPTFGELLRIEYRYNGKTISFQEFGRDKLGRISTMLTETGKQVLHYDRAGRFTGRSLIGSTKPYSKFNYDRNGNRISGHDDERTFKAEYDAHDRLTKYNNTNYYYELNGELAQVATDGGLIDYFYDSFGNLRGVESFDKFIQYQVDGFDRRVAKLVNETVVTRFIWQDQLRLTAELNADGTLRSQFIYSDGINTPDYMIKNGVRYFFIKDHRGSITKVIDIGTGEIKQELKYSEFGEVLLDTNPGFQPFGFAGGLYDPDTKLVRFGARDYDGRIGRWLSKDPIRFDGGTPNLYEYTMSDPANLVDSPGTGPLLGGACLLLDFTYNMGIGTTDYMTHTNNADVYQQQINDLNYNKGKEPNGGGSCSNTSNSSSVSTSDFLENLELSSRINYLEQQRDAEIALATSSFFNGIGNTLAASLICGALLFVPGF